MTGTYASTQDNCLRTVWWDWSNTTRNATITLYAARTKPGGVEEEPYSLELDYLQRLLSFGCWYLQPAQLRPLEPTT